MNLIEKFVYDKVKQSPKLKKQIRNIYQSIFDFIPQPKKHSAYPIIERKGYFFGFHDHTPFSHDNKRLLSNRAIGDFFMPLNKEKLEVGFFEGEDHNKFVPVAKTNSWNWHMGCKLQWRGQSNEIVFNDYIDGQSVAKIINIEDGKESIIPDSISSISPNGKHAIGYSFSRVNKLMPGYGYLNKVSEDNSHIDIPADGIYKITLDNLQKKEIISIKELVSINPLDSMIGKHHFLTHTIFSPDSEKFVFLHRWIDINGDMEKRYSRMIVADLNGKILSIFNTDEMVSHIGWRNSEEIIAYCRLHKEGDKYAIFKVGDEKKFNIIGNNNLISDGHPSFEKTGRWFVTDTYPDRRRMQFLILFDTIENKRFDISYLPNSKKFVSPTIYEHWQCDLHPRWSRNSEKICFDATFSGVRSLCTIALDKDILMNEPKYLKKY